MSQKNKWDATWKINDSLLKLVIEEYVEGYVRGYIKAYIKGLLAFNRGKMK